MRILIAGLLTAALALLTSSPAHINNLASAQKRQAVQAEVPRKEPIEKALTEQQTTPKPEQAEDVKQNASELNNSEQDVKQTPQVVATPQPLTDHEQLMQAAGIQQSDWPAVEFIIMHESSWRPTALNNEGCVGLGQRCPASTLYAACPDLDPVCQLKHFSEYAVTRYGGWQSAYNAWASKKWW